MDCALKGVAIYLTYFKVVLGGFQWNVRFVRRKSAFQIGLKETIPARIVEMISEVVNSAISMIRTLTTNVRKYRRNELWIRRGPISVNILW